jgi:hypothetical protein
MFKFFKAIFSTPQNGTEIIKGARDGIDALIFTDEEKSEMSIKAFKLYLEWVEATKGHNVSRRFIAVVVVLLWAFLILLEVGFKALETLTGVMGGMSEFVFEVLAEQVATPFAVVVGFYFATQLLQRAVGAINSGNEK